MQAIAHTAHTTVQMLRLPFGERVISIKTPQFDGL